MRSPEIADKVWFIIWCVWAAAMARAIARLKDVTVRKATKPGMLADGGGLYLRIGPTGGKSWVFRYRRAGRLHDVGLGPLHTVGLADARQKALEHRQARLNGIDPLERRRAGRAAAVLDAARAISFAACAQQYIDSHKAGWRNAKHAAQWPASLDVYVYPVRTIGMTTTPDSRPRTGQFLPGVSGNPGGRPRGVAEIRDLARQHTKTALDALAEIATAGKSESARVSAAAALLDRGYGRPTQPIAGDSDADAINLAIVSSHEAAIRAIGEAFKVIAAGANDDGDG